MKLYIQITFILIVFFHTNTLFSENNLFSVNNIELEKKNKISNNSLADQAIKKGFNQLINRILLTRDKENFSDLNLTRIKQLVTYYRVSTVSEETNKELLNFSITFDKDKIHQLFYQRGISYSEILDKELYILPILIKNNEVFIFNNNFFYKNWTEFYKENLIEFIIPLENIEIIQKVNKNKDNLINLEISNLLREYSKKNLALVFIEDNKNMKKVYIKSKIQGKNISKSLNFKKQSFNDKEFNIKIIIETKKELINLIKSKNLIDIRTPSFLNAKLEINKTNSLIELNSRIKNIDSVEKIYIQEFNKNFVNLKIKYLGKLEKIINQLKNEKINLQLLDDTWIIKTL
ncbi:MAG: hypothetical protein CNB20_00115 [Pelagibacterales bacterium MED-G43]|nr:MAG: hypothetical protein CNB20_00115 [Pelagibacterales bacterium MED-G43]|tara:strand:- start:1061 stop:2101 length:1041 start_codon:yes stop_codon:yes gene_type:complete